MGEWVLWEKERRGGLDRSGRVGAGSLFEPLVGELQLRLDRLSLLLSCQHLHIVNNYENKEEKLDREEKH